jgi:DNA (cytosine-5)-methyltransferase 1
MLTIGSLCAGACDGLSLGFEWAGLGPVLWQVEIDEARRQNLARHWPDAVRFADIADCGTGRRHQLEHVGCIVASTPCVDLSSAGKRAGLAGPRSGLWFEALRIIGELRAHFVVVENVTSGASNWVPQVRAGLERLGYATLPIPIAAADLGAPHERSRVFIVAHIDDAQQPSLGQHAEVASQPPDVGHAHGDELRKQSRGGARPHREGAPLDGSARAHAGWPTQLELVPPVYGVPRRVVSALGDSVVPQQAEVAGQVIRLLLEAEAAA